MHKVMQLIWIFLYNKDMPPSMKIHIQWMNLMKNHIKQKIQSNLILEERVARQKTHFKNHLIKTFYSMRSKSFRFRCKSHVQLIILPENMFGYPLELILRFFRILCVFGIEPKYSHTIMYKCSKSPLTHEISYTGLFNFVHLSLFHVNVICKKYF
jgi:hypothetical protein